MFPRWLLCCAWIAFAANAGSSQDLNRTPQIWEPFDGYGNIRWEYEQARLDNFAVQLQNEPNTIGYLFVFDGNNVCESEARARALRARDYVVNYRGIPWNRVMWRYDGFAGEFHIALSLMPRTFKPPDPWEGPFQNAPPVKHVTDKCDSRLKRIRNSKPGHGG